MQVCPTGIDIRDGLQYECINCGACVDACDQTMERMGLSEGLISYTTEHKLAHSETQVARPKLIGCGLVMVVMLGVFVCNAMSIMPMGLDILQDRNQLFRETARAHREHLYPEDPQQDPELPDLPAGRGRLPEYQWFDPRGDSEGGRDSYPAGEPGGGSLQPEAPRPWTSSSCSSGKARAG